MVKLVNYRLMKPLFTRNDTASAIIESLTEIRGRYMRQRSLEIVGTLTFSFIESVYFQEAAQLVYPLRLEVLTACHGYYKWTINYLESTQLYYISGGRRFYMYKPRSNQPTL